MALAAAFSDAQKSLVGASEQVVQAFDKLTSEQKLALGALGGLTTAYLATTLLARSADKPTAFELTGGSIASENVDKEFKEYSASYASVGTGQGVTDRSKTVQLVDVFYSLVTDIYEV